MSRYLVILGRSESVDFITPELQGVPAKLDTGAYRSALHAKNIKIKDGKLHFDVLLGHPSYGESQHFEMGTFKEVEVENSFAVRQMRYAVRLKIRIGHKIFTTEFTLTDRTKKPYPILLGRKTLSGRFLVDTSRSNIDRKDLREKHKGNLPPDLEEVSE
jgi:hypothetical protein